VRLRQVVSTAGVLLIVTGGVAGFCLLYLGAVAASVVGFGVMSTGGLVVLGALWDVAS
jgi:hypothetical protein